MTSLEDFLLPTQKQLFKRLAKKFKGKTLISKGNFILVRGQTPVMLVAHLDTVHEQPVRDICLSADKNILMSPQGIGGDDKCGVFALVKIHQSAHVKPWLASKPRRVPFPTSLLSLRNWTLPPSISLAVITWLIRATNTSTVPTLITPFKKSLTLYLNPLVTTCTFSTTGKVYCRFPILTTLVTIIIDFNFIDEKASCVLRLR